MNTNINFGSGKQGRVLLMNPPTAAVSTEGFLNLGYLAASLRKAGHQVKIIDATAPFKPYTADEIEDVIKDFKPDFIGVTLTISNIPLTYEYIKGLSKLGIPIVSGGPHANCLPEEVLRNGSDIVAVGEGEETVVELMEYYLGSRTIEEIKGICFKDKAGNIKFNSPRPLIKDLDTIPFPDYDDFPIRNYTGTDDVNSNPIFWSIFSSRGCPYNCTFCSSHNVFGRVFRMRSVENVFAEIKSLVEKYGCEKITFQDDEILASKKRFIELCDRILDAKLNIKMSIRTRISSIDPDMLSKAKQVGLTRITFGIESWHDETLKNVNKMYTVSKIHEKFGEIERTGFPYVSFNNIIGFPWETKEHFDSTVEQIKKVPINIPYFTVVVTPIPYPGTKLYEDYHKQYGFTDWWLDSNNHPKVISSKNKPFFMYFAFSFIPLFKEDKYWNYSIETKKMIMEFAWKVFKEFLRRHFPKATANLLYWMNKLSHFLWKINPNIEHFAFGIIKKSNFMKLRDNIVFISKY